MEKRARRKRRLVTTNQLYEWCVRCISIAPGEELWYDVYKIGIVNGSLCVLDIDEDYLNSYTDAVFEIPDIFENIEQIVFRKIITHYKNIKKYYTIIMNGLKVLEDNTFSYSDLLVGIQLKNCKVLQEGSLKGCINLKSVEVPNIKTVGKEACSDCEGLEEFIGSPSKIDDFAFKCCTKLTKFNLGKAKNVGNGAFGNCKVLKDIIGSPSHIGARTFMKCLSLDKFDFTNVLTIGDHAFSYTSIKKVVANRCLDMGCSCFAVSDLESFEANRLKRIETQIFLRTNLVEFKAENVNYISSYAFAYTPITSFKSDTVTYTGICPFYGNNKLKFIDLPKLKSLSEILVEKCDNLEYISLKSCSYVRSLLYVDCYAIKRINLEGLKVWYSNTLGTFSERYYELILNKDVVTLPKYVEIDRFYKNIKYV